VEQEFFEFFASFYSLADLVAKDVLDVFYAFKGFS
jgi:hypothetical protein